MSKLTLISWNMQHQAAHWERVLSSGADAALLQEAKMPPPDTASNVRMDSDAATDKANLPWRAAVVGLSDRIDFEPIRTQRIGGNDRRAVMVSRPGTFAPAIVTLKEEAEEEPIILVSLYSYWANPIEQTGSSWIYADASAHRLISDLSAMIGSQSSHRIIAAGDLNILHGYGENGNPYWKGRYDTVFQRMAALGMRFVGPQAPDGGEKAEPPPKELPKDSRNVPTFRTNKNDAKSGTRQLDFVFASESIASRLKVRALNREDEWGPSDHCMIRIDLE